MKVLKRREETSCEVITSQEQLFRWLDGESTHNGATRKEGECCPDFSCCHPGLLATLAERKRFLKATSNKDEKEIHSMLMTFLGRLTKTTKEKVRLAGEVSE